MLVLGVSLAFRVAVQRLLHFVGACVAGDSTVGKTALIKCLCTGGVERGAQYEMVRELGVA